MRAWCARTRVVWMDSDGERVFVLLATGFVQCLRLGARGAQLLWTKRAPTIWRAGVLSAGALAVDWTRDTWFCTFCANDAVDEGERERERRRGESDTFLASFSLFTGKAFGFSKSPIAHAADSYIAIAVDPDRRVVWAIGVGSSLFCWPYSGTSAIGGATRRRARLEDCHFATFVTLTLDRAYQTLVATTPGGKVYAIGLCTWKVTIANRTQVRLGRCLRAHRGRLYVLRPGRVLKLARRVEDGDLSSDYIESVALAFALTPNGHVLVPATCKPKTRKWTPLTDAAQPQGRARLTEIVCLSTALPRELARIIGALHGWFLDAAPTRFGFRTENAASLGTVPTRAFWDDARGCVSFVAIGINPSVLYTQTVFVLAEPKNACVERVPLRLRPKERLCHFGLSGLWTSNDDSIDMTQRSVDTGKQVCERVSPFALLAAENRYVGVLDGELAVLVPHAIRIEVSWMSDHEARGPRLVIPLPTWRGQLREMVCAVAFAAKANVFVWSSGDNQLLKASAERAESTPDLVLAAHWPVGAHNAVCFEASGNPICALSPHAHNTCAQQAIRRIAVSADAELVWMLIGSLVVLLMPWVRDGHAYPFEALAVHSDEIATAGGLPSPWDISDLFVDPVSSQVFLCGGYAVLSFPPCWFRALARKQTIQRILK